MKKIKIFVLLILLLFTAACSTSIKKESIDEEDFIRIMKGEGFNVVSVKEQFTQYNYIEEAYVATNNNYKIEFYELEEDNYAVDFYETNKKIFEETRSNTSVYLNEDYPESNKYTLTTDKEYKVISRIEDTVVYLNMDKKYKDEASDILKKLGY